MSKSIENETFADIIEDIKSWDFNGVGRARKPRFHHGGNNTGDDPKSAVLEALERVRHAIASTPSEWFVVDSGGNEIHLGDYYQSKYGNVHQAIALGDGCISYHRLIDNSHSCRKVEILGDVGLDMMARRISEMTQCPMGDARELVKDFAAKVGKLQRENADRV